MNMRNRVLYVSKAKTHCSISRKEAFDIVFVFEYKRMRGNIRFEILKSHLAKACMRSTILKWLLPIC